jgi:methanogen homocitrate synthase
VGHRAARELKSEGVEKGNRLNISEAVQPPMKKFEVSPFNKEYLAGVDLPEKVVLYDSTLRDGEQMPGVAFSLEEKVEIAQLLADIGVGQIEAGFPAVSMGERNAVRKIASLGTGAEVLALARTNEKDIDAAVDCGVDLVMIFTAASDLHREVKYKISREEQVERVGVALEHARARGVKYSFSTEDSTRTKLDYIIRLSRLAEERGAYRVGLADTTGCILPNALGALVRNVVNEVNVPVSVHLHNDFGLGLANALASIENGATAVATTVNGIGERAGNVPLEQMTVALEVLCGVETGIDTTKLKKLCERVSELSGVRLSSNHPWVGKNVFRHESGIHIAAIESDPHTYECVLPEFVGASRAYYLGKHSGTFSVMLKLKSLGLDIEDDKVFSVLQTVKKAAEEGQIITDDWLRRTVDDINGD